eukprot:COSAG02_NODE_38223_length_431_cov_3.774096_1_plen_74_part_10
MAHALMRYAAMRTLKQGSCSHAYNHTYLASSPAPFLPSPDQQVTGGTMAEEPLQVVGLPSKLPLELGELPEDAL